VSDLLRDGLGVRSLSLRIDEGQNDRTRMLLWLHRSIDAMERVGKGWKDIKETGMRMLSGGEQEAKQDIEQSMHGEKQVAASLHRGIAAASGSTSATKEGKSAPQQSLPSKL